MIQSVPRFSVVIPAHNEEFELPATLSAFSRAAEYFKRSGNSGGIEFVLVDNCCTDKTAQIAQDWGAIVVREERRQISRVRNTGAQAASGEILITCDADSHPDERIFVEIDRRMSGTTFAGGVTIWGRDMRLSYWPIFLLLNLVILIRRCPGGLFFLRREDFLAMGGFNEELYALEDVEFSFRLKKAASDRQKRISILASTPIRTSTRKFRLCTKAELLRVAVRAWTMPKKTLRSKSDWDPIYYRDGLRENHSS